MDIQELKQKLEVGDMVQIAKIAGCSTIHVNKVFYGTRNSDTPTGRRIKEVAIKIIENRESLKFEYKH